MSAKWNFEQTDKMMSIKTFFTAVALIVLNGISSVVIFAQNDMLTPNRKLELDSLVYQLPSKAIQNPDKVSTYVSQYAKNDYEKAWMFYAYIAIHLNYDKKRGNSSTKYSPYLTAYKKSGVCRDFAQLFSFLLTKNNIPNYVVVGKVPATLRSKIIKLLHHRSNLTNHAWNIAKINNQWFLFDVTWANQHCIRYKDGNRIKQSVPNVPSVYFMPNPLTFAQTHKPANPLFYLLNTYPKYNGKFGSQRYSANPIDFESILSKNELMPFSEFSPTFNSLTKHYSKHDFLLHNYRLVLAHLNAQRTPNNPLTREGFYRDSIVVSQLTAYIQTNYRIDLSQYANQFYTHYFEVKQISN